MRNSRPKNLVISGGGVNGIAVYSAITELTEKNYLSDLKRVAGTSSGALTALCVALNFSVDDFKEKLNRFEPKKLMSRSSWLTTPLSFFKKFGIFDHLYVTQLITDILNEKTGLAKDVTFADLQRCKEKEGFRDLYVTATNISRRVTVIFSHEHTPHVRISDAIYASMAAPYIFSTISFLEEPSGQLVRHKDGDVLGDGAILNNYALHIFDYEKYLETPSSEMKKPDAHVCNPDTLGICLVDNKEKIRWIKHHEKPSANRLPSILHHTNAVSEMMIAEQRLETLKNSPADITRTLLVSAEGNHPFNFLMGAETNKKLDSSGKEAAQEHLLEDEKPELRAKL